MAEASKKAPAVSMSLFLEMSDLEIEADLASMATLFLAEAVWVGRWDEARCGKPLAGRCVDQRVRWSVKTGDLGIGFPSWHALIFGAGVFLDMKVVCRENVKKKSGQRGCRER